MCCTLRIKRQYLSCTTKIMFKKKSKLESRTKILVSVYFPALVRLIVKPANVILNLLFRVFSVKVIQWILVLGCVTVEIIPDLPYKTKERTSKSMHVHLISTFLSLGNFGIKHLSMILTSPHLTTRGHCFQTSAI